MCCGGGGDVSPSDEGGCRGGRQKEQARGKKEPFPLDEFPFEECPMEEWRLVCGVSVEELKSLPFGYQWYPPMW